MDENIFNRDWELSERLNKLARDYLREGVSIDETMQLVLNSEEYCTWKAAPRCFQIAIDQRGYYEDIAGDMKWKKYTDKVDTYINDYFLGIIPKTQVELKEYDFIFEQLGMQVSVTQLGYEIAQLSKMIGVDKPLNYGHLLCLFNGTVITDLEEEQLQCLLSKEEEVAAFVESFYERYRSSKE